MSKIDETYHNLLNKILKDGFKYEDPNRKNVNRIQISSYQFKHDFKDGFPAITTKKLYWKGIVGELLWFLRGDTNIKYLVDNGINIWNKDAYNYYLSFNTHNSLNLNDWTHYSTNNRPLHMNKTGILNYEFGDLGRVYGAQWRNFRGPSKVNNGPEFNTIDQISNLIKGLKETPMGTKHIVTAWNPAELDDMALPPCHWSFEIIVEPTNNKSGLHLNHAKALNEPDYQFTLKWHQRSVDSFLGKM